MSVQLNIGAYQPEELQLAAKFLSDFAALRVAQHAAAEAAMRANPNGNFIGLSAGQLSAAAPQIAATPIEAKQSKKSNPPKAVATAEPAPQPSISSAITSPSVTDGVPSVEDVRKQIAVLTGKEDTRKQLSALMKGGYGVTALVDLAADKRVEFLGKCKELAETAGVAWS